MASNLAACGMLRPMRRLIPIPMVLMTTAVAGCGGTTRDPRAGCKGMTTVRPSYSGVGFSGIGADPHYVCAHVGAPRKIVRDIGLVSWVYANAIVRWDGGHVQGVETMTDPRGITFETQRDPVISGSR